MARREVVRSGGETVTLCLKEISNFRDRVVIEIPQPPYNGAFEFVPHTFGHNRWVLLRDRKSLNAEEPSTLHVSKPVFRGMAEWACAILNARRFKISRDETVTVGKEPIEWEVLWRSDAGEAVVAMVRAVSEKQATYLGWLEWTAGTMPSITYDRMRARPLVTERVMEGPTRELGKTGS